MAAKNSDNRVNNLVWGVLLSLAGVGLLLFNLDVFVRFEPYVQYGAAGLLGLLALLFVGGYLSARDNWWRLIPGWTLIALAAMVYLTTLSALDQRITAGGTVRRPGDGVRPHLSAGPGRALVGDHSGRVHADAGRDDRAEQSDRGAGGAGHGPFHWLGGSILSVIPPGTAVAAVVGAGSGLCAGAAGPVPVFGWPRTTEPTAAIVAGAVAFAGRVADMAGDASSAQPQAECRCRAQSVPIARSVIGEPAAPAQAGRIQRACPRRRGGGIARPGGIAVNSRAGIMDRTSP